MKTRKTLTVIGVAILLCLTLTAALTSCKNKDSDTANGGEPTGIITDSGNGGDAP